MSTEDEQRMARFLDSLTHELMAMPDNEVLNGGDPEQIMADARERIDRAKQEAGWAKVYVKDDEGNVFFYRVPPLDSEQS